MGFGGYSGSTNLAEEGSTHVNHPDGTSFVSGDTHTLDPRIAACLSHATRPNQSTKRRALRDVVALIEGRASSYASSVTDVRESPTDEGFDHLACSPETVAAALPQWHRAFARLADDDHAETRLAAARANAAFCAPPVPRASVRWPPCPGPLPWPVRSL